MKEQNDFPVWDEPLPHDRRLLIGVGGVLAACLLAGAIWFVVRRDSNEEAAPVAPTTLPQAAGNVPPAGLLAGDGQTTTAAVVETGLSPGGARLPSERAQPEERAGMGTNAISAADLKALDRLQAFLDDNDDAQTLAAARELMGSDAPEVRSRVIEALGWIGVKALPELTRMLGDVDEDVSSEAFDQWKLALGEIEQPLAKAEMLTAAARLVRDPNRVDELMMEFSLLPDAIAVRHLADLIKTAPPLISGAAREHYEFMTGDPYTNDAAVETWIRENVEEPDETPLPS